MKKSNQTPAVQNTLSKITPEEVAAKAREMELARVAAVGPEDSAKIMRMIANQALNGSLQAAEMYYRLSSPSGFPTPTEEEQERTRPVGNVVQVNVGKGTERVTVASIDRAGLQVAQMLMNAGPMTPKAITSRLNVPQDTLDDLVEEGVLEKSPRGKIQLTETGRQVVEQAGGE